MIRRKTKIIATIGPATNTYEKLEQLYLAGVNAFRLNFSHGTHEDHLKIIQMTEKLAKEHDAHIGLLADLQGPKLRVGIIENEGVLLKQGAIVKVVTYPVVGTKDLISVSYKTLAEDVNDGELILIDDGKISLVVESSNKKDTVICRVVEGGVLSSNKGFNLPSTKISVPSLTEKDRRDLDFILQHPINWVALSFVREAKEIEELREIIQSKGANPLIMAKIEKPEAVKNIDAIIQASDAVMVARGDLAVEVPMEEMA